MMISKKRDRLGRIFAFAATLIMIAGCSKNLPLVVEKNAPKMTVDFELEGVISDSMDTDVGIVYFIEGTYGDISVYGSFKRPDHECPYSIEFKSSNGNLSYKMREADKKLFSKGEVDKCVIYYVDSFTVKFDEELKNFKSY